MVDDEQAEFGLGLSDEEVKDLEQLIKNLKDNQIVSGTQAENEELKSQVKFMSENLIQLSEMLLNLDVRMKSFYKIVRLSFQKSEIMNNHINSIIHSIAKIKKISSE